MNGEQTPDNGAECSRFSLNQAKIYVNFPAKEISI